MDIKELLIWSWNHKWWFVISVAVCLGIGTLYFFTTPPKREVKASIMLRTTDLQSQQGEMMSLMGVDGSKMAADEIEVLTSHDLMEQIVDSFHLTIKVERREHLRWIPVFPCPEFALAYDQPVLEKTVYRLKEGDERYRITVYPRMSMVGSYIKRINVKRLGRESQVITLSMTSANPNQSVAILNLLLDLYNKVSRNDKYAIAVQAKSFLDERLAAVQAELNEAEVTMEAYKSMYQLNNIENKAINYQDYVDDYERQLASIDLIMSELDDLDEQLQSPLINTNSRILYADIKNVSLSAFLTEYNSTIAKRIDLLSSATETNPRVLNYDSTLQKLRTNIKIGVEEARLSYQTRQKHLHEQINKYSSMLTQLPEHERTYMEMQRNTETKEKQYLYLIGKNEENALLLVSSSLSAKVVSSPQASATIASPSIIKTWAVSIFMGMLLPLLLYFFEVVRKEFL